MRLPFPLHLLLPYRRPTEAEARQALESCGIEPHSIIWRIETDGSLSFEQPYLDQAPLTSTQLKCLMNWGKRERVRIIIIE